MKTPNALAMFTREARTGAAVRSGPSWWAVASARMFPSRYDAQVEACRRSAPSSALDVHRARLVSRAERIDLARALHALLADARHRPLTSGRVPVRQQAVADCTGLLVEVLGRLTADDAVQARGMARLRLLLADGRSPLYRTGRASLAAALRGVLAVL